MKEADAFARDAGRPWREHRQSWCRLCASKDAKDRYSKKRLGFDLKTVIHERRWTRAATVRPTIRDLEWAAGFLDGEGCPIAYNGTQRFSALQADTEPLNRLLRLFGGSLISQSDRARKKPAWLWQVHGARARGVMMTLYLLFSARRRSQIHKALASPLRSHSASSSSQRHASPPSHTSPGSGASEAG